MKWTDVLKFFGIIAALVAFCVICFGLDFLSEELLAVLSVLILLVLAAFLIRPHLRRRREEIQLRMQQANINPESDPDSSILYLRPFHLDNTGISPTDYDGKTYYTVESLLCAFMKRYGLPIAIGKPGEKLQPLGAVRIYTHDLDWKSIVRDCMEKAQCVILYVEFTEGVKWEINEVLQEYLDKLILVPKIYHAHGSQYEKASLFLGEFALISYPLTKFFHRNLLFLKSRRGRKYYRTWDREMCSAIPPGFIDDRTAAIIFCDGKPVPYLVEEATIEEQFEAIAAAVLDKMKEDNQYEEGSKRKDHDPWRIL